MEGQSSHSNNCNSIDGPNTASVSLLDLNEHCLLKIFNYLYIDDTARIAITCKKLYMIAKMAIKKCKKFDLTEYQRYVKINEADNKYRRKPKRTLSLGAILMLVSSTIESLNLHTTYFCSNSRKPNEWELIKKCIKFTKLKTLTVRNSNTLKWIKADNIEELEIRQVNPDELNNFAHGMTKLKKFTIGDISKDLSIPEIYYFLEKNQNMECLKFDEMVPFGFKIDIFPRMRNLKELHLTFGKCVPHLMDLLNIEKLTVLGLKFRQSFSCNNHKVNYPRIKILLKKLSEKKTIETLALHGMVFSDPEIYNDLSLASVVSLIIEPERKVNFYWKLANTPFQRLKHLHMAGLSWSSYEEILCLIEHLKTLERFTSAVDEQDNMRQFLEQVNVLLGHSSRTNNAFELELTTNKTVKVLFHLGRYKVNAVAEDDGYTGLFEKRQERTNDGYNY